MHYPEALAPSAISNKKESPEAADDAARNHAGRPLSYLRSIIGIWMRRHRDRQALLDLLESDHRIARDILTTTQELMAWAQKPFWRA